jgi:hypothetical protein
LTPSRAIFAASRAASLATALLTAGCDAGLDIERLLDDIFGRDTGDRPDPETPKPPIDETSRVAPGDPRGGDLGEAQYPAGKTDATKPTVHSWLAPTLRPSRYKLSYRMADEAARAVLGEFDRFSKAVGHKRIDDASFQWRPPQRCLGGLHCVYEELMREGNASVAPIAELFRLRAERGKLDAGRATALVVTFVQEVKYHVPDDQPFGILPPSLVVQKNLGDCDSKALLAHMILQTMGVPSVIVSSDAHRHTMLAVALPAPGTSFDHQGRRYAFVEMTASRSPIGHIHPKLLSPNDWRVVPLPELARAQRIEAGKKDSVQKQSGK